MREFTTDSNACATSVGVNNVSAILKVLRNVADTSRTRLFTHLIRERVASRRPALGVEPEGPGTPLRLRLYEDPTAVLDIDVQVVPV